MQGCSVSCPSLARATTETARPSWWLTLVTVVSVVRVLPAAVTLSRQTSHIIPGPYLGYWNSSMREVISFWLRFGARALTIALPSERPLTRCAAQSAGMSATGTPQSFSV